MSEFVKTQQEKILTKADLVKYSFKEKVEEIYECNWKTMESMGNGWKTIYVYGFRGSLTREDTKSALRKHFSSCGEIKRLYVPIECKTGVPLGFAFMDLLKDEEKKALTLDGSYLERRRLVVAMARDREESIVFHNFKGCKHCAFYRIKLRRSMTSFYATYPGPTIARALGFKKKLADKMAASSFAV